jgi:glutamine amidotransferase-like uncharacterized protein
MQQILVYVDQGVDGGALKHTVKALQQEVDLSRHMIKMVNAAALKNEPWEEATSLLVIPGGRDVYYHNSLDGQGTDKIRAFIENGGNYLGICAGGYFACSAIEFEKGGSLEVCDTRSLMFFPGIAEGPAYGKNKYRYDSSQGVQAAHLNWKENEEFHAYFNGGCQFAQPEKYPNVTVLGSYRDLESSPAAIVDCKVGRGRALLTGVHLEYSVEHLHRSNPYIERIFTFLQKGEKARKKIFREMLQIANIQIR